VLFAVLVSSLSKLEMQPLFQKQIILGLWPIAGVTTVGVTERDAITTIETAIQNGIKAFDTAYGYGLDGESDRYLGRVLGQLSNVDSVHVIGKVGQRYLEGKRVIDCRPDTLRHDAEESLDRLGLDRFDTLMLHCVDEQTPLEDSAAAIGRLKENGLAKRIGICNATVQQRAIFAQSADCQAIQCPLNLLQQETLSGVIANAFEHGCDVLVYWTLMKGLLAGKISRDQVFAPGDSRPGYAVFQGEARQRAHRVVDGLAELASKLSTSVAALSTSWALSQPGVTGVLVGARRPDQVREIANTRVLSSDSLDQIDAIIQQMQ
jgi:aryl-alcohol dehydrogenase-like predicted oxidoreductase